MSSRLTEIRRQIARSAAFRLTVRFAAIFVVCLITLGLVAGLGARWLVESDIREDVSEELERLQQVYAESGAGAVAAAVERFAADEELSAGHLAADGTLLAGTLALPALAEGWSEFLPPGVDDDETLWTRTARLPDGSHVAVAASSEGYHDIVELMQTGAVWTVVIALPLALLSGALLSVAVLRRLAPIAATAEGVGEGALSGRAPVSARGDEFDRLAADINAMLDRIESLTRNLRNVSVGIAHELRTPLARARNRLVEMQRREEPPDPAVAGVLGEIDALMTTFDALLKIGQIEAEAERRGFETVALSELAAGLVETYEPVAAERRKRLDARIVPGITLSGNPALLTQMISNLIENAIEHTPEGTCVTLVLSRGASGPVLVVEDDGPGIPAEESERVFDRFHRLERSRTTPGNGLGLSLVRSICGLHGFTVSLRPTAPGARFEVAM